MSQRPAHLPGVLGDIARVAGEEAALKIAHAVGGTEAYIPPIPANDHWLCELVGIELAREIADHLTCGVSGMRLELPSGPRGFMKQAAAQVDRMLAQGRSERDIALATGYTIRGVRQRRAKLNLPQDSRQGNLYDV